MKKLRAFLDNLEPLFTRGGRFERFHAIFEAVDTFLFSPGDLTRGSPHIRDAIDLKRVMILVVIAATPAALVGMWNTGFQANMAMQGMGLAGLEGWRGVVLPLLGAGYDPASIWDCTLQGALYFVPIYIVTMVVGLGWEILFAGVRNHEVNEGFFVTGFLFALIVPATIPLWQVAVGISFGVIIGKEVFGGTGKNFLNPALVARAFLYFAYPAQISGDAVWTAVDGFSGATALGISAIEGLQGVLDTGLTWTQAFLGQMQGSIGEVSAAACLLGAIILIFTRIASWRIIAFRMLRPDHPNADLWQQREQQRDDGHAVALAHGPRRLRIRRGLYGNRSRQCRPNEYRQVDLRLPDRVHDLAHSCR